MRDSRKLARLCARRRPKIFLEKLFFVIDRPPGILKIHPAYPYCFVIPSRCPPEEAFQPQLAIELADLCIKTRNLLAVLPQATR